MKIAESDVLLTNSIAKLLGVELEPWQEFMLKHMLAGYRQRFESEVMVAMPDTPREACRDVHPSSAGAVPIRCHMARGHTGMHTDGRLGWDTVTRDSSIEPCGEQMPSARIPATCAKPAGHPGKHVVGAGDLTGSMWYSPE